MSDTSLVFNLVARDRASAVMERMGDRFKAASATIGAGIGVALGVGVAASLDMEAANSKLVAQLGVGPAEAAELSKVSASVYGNAWGESTAEVNEAIKGVYQQIGDTSQAEGGLEGVTTKVMALSETFDQDLAGTTAAAGQMIKTGLADNADEALDILTRGFQTGTDKAGDLLDTMTEYGTQFRKFGLDGKMATGLLSQGLKAGARDADTVADTLKEFSIRAIDGSKKSAAGFEALGLSAKGMTAQIGQGGEKATAGLDTVLDKLRGMKDPVAQQAAAVALFGTKAEDLGASLFALDPSSAVAALGKVGGAADKMAKTLHDNPAAALEKFKRQATQKLAAVAGTFINFAMDNQQVMEPLAYTLGGIAATVLVVRGAMMAWAAAQAVWSAATTVATGAQWLWNSALFASPITWIIVGIIALIAVIVLIATKTTWFQTLWRVTWDAVKVAATTVWDALKTAFTATINFFVWQWQAVSSTLSTAWNATWGAIKSAVETVWNGIKWVVATQINAVRTTITNVMNVVRSVVRTVWGWIKTFIGLQVTAVKRAISGLSSIVGQVRGFFGRMKDAAVDRVTALVAFVRGIPGKVRSALGDLNGLLVGAGRSIIRGLINGISGMVGALKDKLGGITNIIPDWKGPMSVDLKLLAPSGKALMSGLMTGIDSQLPALHAQLTGVTKSVSDDVQPAVSGPAPTNMAPPPVGATNTTIRIEVAGPEEMKRLLRGIVRKDGRGNVQVAFGTGGS